MKNETLIGLVLLGGVLGSWMIIDVGLSPKPFIFDVFNWVSDHSILSLLAISEAYAILPTKAKGISHSAVLTLKKVTGFLFHKP